MRDGTSIRAHLEALNDGDRSAWDRLIPLIYDQLRQQAHAVLRNERNTLQATALLHDALVDLLEQDLDGLKFEGPARFFALASHVIRNRLQDHIRRRNAAKRGGGEGAVYINLADEELPSGLRSLDVLAINEALDQLREYDERLWMVTELKFFCGLTNKEVADAQGIAVKTVESDWTFAKAWLQRRLGESG